MKTAGIIAEYNPLHNGHLYQIKKLRSLQNIDYLIIVMSGDFVQRGEPAIYDKYIRTQAALNAGADLVLELPSVFATSSAEDFSSCAVALLDKLGVVDLLCFGSECGDLIPLTETAAVLNEEPEAYKKQLKNLLRQGLSYPAARDKALSSQMENTPNILTSPNNILGLEYIKALQKRSSSIKPFTIKREGAGYHDKSSQGFASATGIRHMIGRGEWESLSSHVPSFSTKAYMDSVPVFPDDLSLLLNYRLLEAQYKQDPLEEYLDMSWELAGRLKNMSLEFSTFSERIQQLKTKQYTYTRISRALLHMILGMTAANTALWRSLDYVSYGRVLGFRKASAPLLNTIKKNASIPLVTKVADAQSILDPVAFSLFSSDLYASHLYQSIGFEKSGHKKPNEYTRSVIVL